MKLLSTKKRHNMSAAVSKFNKANPTEKLHTCLLGYGEAKSPIFVSEHLSPYLKDCTRNQDKILNTFRSVMVAYLFVRMKPLLPNRLRIWNHWLLFCRISHFNTIGNKSVYLRIKFNIYYQNFRGMRSR